MTTDNGEKVGFKKWVTGITPGQILMSVIGGLFTLVLFLVGQTFAGYKESVDSFGKKVDKLEVTISETNTTLEGIKTNFVISDKQTLQITSDLRIDVGILKAKVESLEKKK